MGARQNYFTHIGNLTRDPELKHVQIGGEDKVVANFGMAIQRQGKDAPADFFDYAVWGPQAEALVKYKQKGNPLQVSGEARYRTWETEEGNKRSKVDFLAFNIQYLGQGPPKGSENTGTGDGEVDESDFEDIPF